MNAARYLDGGFDLSCRVPMSTCRERGSQDIDDQVLLRTGHCRVQWQENAFVLRLLRMGEPAMRGGSIRRLAVDAHDSTPGRHAMIEHRLHDLLLVGPRR